MRLLGSFDQALVASQKLTSDDKSDWRSCSDSADDDDVSESVIGECRRALCVGYRRSMSERGSRRLHDV